MGKCISLFLIITVILGLLVLSAFFVVFLVTILYLKDNYQDIITSLTDSLSMSMSMSLKTQMDVLSDKVDTMTKLLENH